MRHEHCISICVWINRTLCKGHWPHTDTDATARSASHAHISLCAALMGTQPWRSLPRRRCNHKRNLITPFVSHTYKRTHSTHTHVHRWMLSTTTLCPRAIHIGAQNTLCVHSKRHADKKELLQGFVLCVFLCGVSLCVCDEWISVRIQLKSVLLPQQYRYFSIHSPPCKPMHHTKL